MQIPFPPPVPPGFIPSPGPADEVFFFCMTYCAPVLLVLLALPKKCSRKLVQIMLPLHAD
jgi:hypothetical protein